MIPIVFHAFVSLAYDFWVFIDFCLSRMTRGRVKETTNVVKNKWKMLNKSLDNIALVNKFTMR